MQDSCLGFLLYTSTLFEVVNRHFLDVHGMSTTLIKLMTLAHDIGALRVGDQNIKNSESVRNLGSWFDEKFSVC